jgi:hypothetical protein
LSWARSECRAGLASSSLTSRLVFFFGPNLYGCTKHVSTYQDCSTVWAVQSLPCGPALCWTHTLVTGTGRTESGLTYQTPCATLPPFFACLARFAFPVSTPRIRCVVNASSFPRSPLRLSDPAAMARNPGCTVFIGEISLPPCALPSYWTRILDCSRPESPGWSGDSRGGSVPRKVSLSSIYSMVVWDLRPLVRT